MSEYSVADTKNRLSELLDRAERGEEVVVTRHGKPVAKITPIRPEPKRITPELMEWWDRNIVKPKKPFGAAKVIRQMRDEGN